MGCLVEGGEIRKRVDWWKESDKKVGCGLVERLSDDGTPGLQCVNESKELFLEMSECKFNFGKL